MLNRIKILVRFIGFYFRAKTQYNVHSPFVFEFVQNVLEDDRAFYVFHETDILRGELLASKESIEVEDFGAGSVVDGLKKTRKIRSIAGSALSPAFQCQWLFKTIELYKPLTVIELGTSLGISTLHLAEGAPRRAKIMTLEGSPEIAKAARRNFDWFYDTFRKTGLRHNDPSLLNFDKYADNFSTEFEKHKIEIVVGKFDETLPKVLSAIDVLNFAFIDGNHQRLPTIDYFEQCLTKANDQTVLIFDDIHWSEDMEAAWGAIKGHPRVRLSIDLFWCGIVFFRNENREKEHFDLIKARLKPFSTGLFG
ncbi:MAG: class I SAM-dependent methyltransferase [Saprospiraceae bacterium]|nr:class I SAM-dependent methyltransferase [Saprospiraceae bacterium]